LAHSPNIINAAKVRPKYKKIESLLSILVKITSHATVPLRVAVVNVVGGELMQGGQIKSKPCITLLNIRKKLNLLF
jgi:hypothetical protein